MYLFPWRGGSRAIVTGGSETEWLRLREAGAKNALDACGVDGGVDGREAPGLPLTAGHLAPGNGATRSRSSTSGKSPAEPASRCR